MANLSQKKRERMLAFLHSMLLLPVEDCPGLFFKKFIFFY